MSASLDFSSTDDLVRQSTRYLFFTGKGGVGKTSLASATAIRLADSGKQVLLVSTDPASNLDEILGQQLNSTPQAISGQQGLYALNLDPAAAAAAYRERIVGPMRGLLPEAALKSMEEQLSGACTMEIAAFDEFTQLLADPEETRKFDHIVFDTAPTGHTLRLLALPRAWSNYLDENKSGTSCLGPLAGLTKQREQYATALSTLAEKHKTTIMLVTRPRTAPLQEAKRAAEELSSLGIQHFNLLINAIFPNERSDDPVALSLQSREQKALEEYRGFIQSYKTYGIALQQNNLVGLKRLKQLLSTTPTKATALPDEEPVSETKTLNALIDDLEASGKGVIMTMGKGGVGKTTVAAAIAAELASRGHSVHLSTTDPAAHLARTLDQQLENLEISRIDPVAETKQYRQQVLAEQGTGMDKEQLALLEEDLKSPCTEEIAVFRAFARIVAKATNQFVVIDTAPTGHTLLLLDTTEAYHRELGRQSKTTITDNVRLLLPRLRDPDFTRILLVTLPEATPVHEAMALRDDLKRAEITPYAWIINQSFHAIATKHPLLQARARNETTYINEVASAVEGSAPAIIKWQVDEPTGLDSLRRLRHDELQPA